MALINIEEFVSDYDDTQVFYDPSFQRRVVWKVATTGKFIESVTRGWAELTTIVEADVDKCLRHSRKAGCLASVEYFERVRDKGYRYISLDGQNRSKKVISFMTNEIPISGKFRDADGKDVIVKNKHFKDFPQRLQDKIRDAHLTVKLAPACVQHELSEQFEALNSGDPLWNQEKRNANLTPVARWVRSERTVLQDALERVVKVSEITRMLDDELVAKMAMILTRNNPATGSGEWDTGSGEIDRFYTLGSDYSNASDEGHSPSKKELDRAEDILDMWLRCITKQTSYAPSQAIPKKIYWAVLYMCEWAYDNDYYININSYATFVEAIKDVNSNLEITSEADYSSLRTAALSSGRDPDLIKQKDFYFSWVNLPHQKDSRRKRIASLSEGIKAHGTTVAGLRMKAPMAAK